MGHADVNGGKGRKTVFPILPDDPTLREFHLPKSGKYPLDHLPTSAIVKVFPDYGDYW